MPRTRTETLYTYDELAPEAKAKAIEAAQKDAYEDPDLIDTDYLYEDWTTIGGILGVEFDYRDVPLMSGKTRREPKFWWSGFGSQGDGACFEGCWTPADKASEQIRDHAPQDADLHAIADNLTAIVSEFRTTAPGPGPATLWARVKHNDRYYHSRSVDFEIGGTDQDDNDIEIASETEEAIKDELRDLMDWMYKQLEADHEYRLSDEALIERLEGSGAEFFEDGSPA